MYFADVSKIGIILALIAAMCWATSVTIMDHLVAHLPVEAVAGIRYLIAALIISAIIPAKGLNINLLLTILDNIKYKNNLLYQ